MEGIGTKARPSTSHFMTFPMHHTGVRSPSARPADPTLLRALPQVQKLMETEAARELTARFPRAAVVDAVRNALEAMRRALPQ